MQTAIKNHYQQLHQYYRYLINQGDLRSDDKLPSEREIGEQFSLARITVRQALQTLEADGLIYRINRKGWFVSPPALKYNPAKWLSFIEYASYQGFVPHTEVLHQSLVEADNDIATLLKVDLGARLLHLHRRRSLNGRAVLIEHIFINPSLVPDIEQEDLSQSLTHLLRRNYGETYHSMDLSFKSTALPESAACELGVPASLPGLHIQRTNARSDGLVLEVDFEYWRHDAVTIDINMKGEHVIF